jgi:hypothetical protein
VTLDQELVEALEKDYTTAPITPQERVMLDYVVKLTKDATKCWKDDIEGLRAAGFDDRGILQITLIASWFNYINRVADPLLHGVLAMFLQTIHGHPHFTFGLLLVALIVRNGFRLAADSPSERVCVKESGVSKVKISWVKCFLPSSYRSSERTSPPSFQSALSFKVRQPEESALSHHST